MTSEVYWRLNQCLETYLRCMTSEVPKKWYSWIFLAEYWYNTNYHTALKSTPFQALYGYAPPYLSLKSYVDSTSGEVKDMMLQREIMLHGLKENLCNAQNRMKLFVDQTRTKRSFDVGEQVYLKLQPYRQNSVHIRRYLKLASRYYGLYTVMQKVGEVAYRLDLPPGSKIHLVFHVSLLKNKLSKKVVLASQLPNLTSDDIIHTYPIMVLDRKTIRRGKSEVEQILVCWAPESSNLASWEDIKYIQKKFPTFNPWGQGSSIEGGIVVNLKTENNLEELDWLDDSPELMFEVVEGGQTQFLDLEGIDLQLQGNSHVGNNEKKSG